MGANLIVDDLLARLSRQYGRARQAGRARVVTFGPALTCSVNYSKLLGGHKFFFAVPGEIIDPAKELPATEHGAFVLLICGSADKTLVLPRRLMIEMMEGVSTRRVDVFLEDGTYILQTTGHPKLDVTEFLNALPRASSRAGHDPDPASPPAPDRTHAKIQWSLTCLGVTEGCAVWVPPNDRNLSYQGRPFADCTLAKLPRFGFDENTRRIVQNIDVLWLTRNVIRKAFEIEATTSIYSGLLRLNDLVLAQPNNQIDLHLVAPASRRERVRSQLVRPLFQGLLPRTQFVTFEHVEEQMERLGSLRSAKGVRVSGLIQGERFGLPEHFMYPSDL
jgi:hypothetical protein